MFVVVDHWQIRLGSVLVDDNLGIQPSYRYGDRLHGNTLKIT